MLDNVVGVYHFLADRAPQNLPVVAPKPSKISPWRKDGKAIVAKVKAGENVKASIEGAISLLGGIGQVIHSGDKVMVKPNFNSPDPFPASTDLTFLRAVIELLKETVARVTIGESAGGMWRPTRTVYRKLGLYDFARERGVDLIAFDDPTTEWVKVKINGDFLEAVTMPRPAYEAEKLIYLPCMKTHNLAGFSGALKLAFGFVHPGERRGFHISHLQQKLAEVNLSWQPDLIIMDGRKAFVSGGPDKGELAEPGVILASGDPVATDAEAVKIILSYRGNNKLPADPWRLPQLVIALKHRLGASEGNYIVVE